METTTLFLLLMFYFMVPKVYGATLSVSGKRIEGNRLTLKCDTIYTPVYWYRNDMYVGESSSWYSNECSFHRTALYNLYEFRNCGSKNRLRIKSLRKDDNYSTWQCSDGYDRSPVITILLNIQIYGSSNVGYAGDTYNFTCTTDEARSIRWFLNDRQIGFSSKSASCTSKFSSNGYDLYSCGLEHILVIDSLDYNRHRGKWSCAYWVQQGWIGSSEQLDVKYHKLSVSLNGSQIIGREGEAIRITCQTKPSFASTKIYLRIGTKTIHAINGTDYNFMLDYNLTLDRSYNFEKIYCCAENDQESSVYSKRRSLTVYHAPRLYISKEEDTNSTILTCSVIDAYPYNITFMLLRHFKDGQLIREINGTNINTTTLSLNLSASYGNDGLYICSATNGIIDTITKSDIQRTNFTERALPEYIDDKEEIKEYTSNDQLLLNSTVYSSTDANFTWYYEPILIADGEMNTNESILIDYGEMNTINESIQHPYNDSVSLPVTKVQLTIDSISANQSGNYYCKSCNVYGCSRSSDILLIIKDIPNQDQLRLPDTIAVVTSVTCVLIVIAIVLIATVVFVRRRRNSLNNTVQARHQNDLYIYKKDNRNHSKQPPPPYHEINNHHVKGGANLIIIPNDLYVSTDSDGSEPEYRVTNDSVSEYGEVKKINTPDKQDLVIIPNELYVSADDDIIGESTNTRENPALAPTNHISISQLKEDNEPIYGKVEPIYENQDEKNAYYNTNDVTDNDNVYYNTNEETNNEDNVYYNTNQETN